MLADETLMPLSWSVGRGARHALCNFGNLLDRLPIAHYVWRDAERWVLRFFPFKRSQTHSEEARSENLLARFRHYESH